MDINTNDFVNQLTAAIQNSIKELKKLNIMVLGKSGVGKSTLINSVFRDNMAETGIGEPVTKSIKKYTKADYPLAIYDTPGFEVTKGQTAELKKEVLDIIQKGVNSRDISQMLHCVWYCVSVAGDRTFDDGELEWLKELTDATSINNVPVIVVLTKAYDMDDAKVMKDKIDAKNLDIKKVIPVVAQEKRFNGGAYVVPACNLDVLVQVMQEVLVAKKELRKSFQNVQKVNLAEKKKMAHSAVAAGAAAAVATGASPIPFSDAALLIPTQVTMIASITAIFGVEVNKGILTALVSSTLGSAGATVLGKTAISNILKFIPGVGTVAGAVISGSTAGVITTALGESYILLMEKLFLGEISAKALEGEQGKQLISEAFKQWLKKR